MNGRREFIMLLGGAATWPLAAQAQQSQRARRVGVLSVFAEHDPVGQVRAAALVQGLDALTWHEGSNLRIDWRWAGGDTALYERYAAELVSLGPDVLVAIATPSVAALRRRTTTIPIVFAGVTDPVGQGFVASLSRPAGNVTGFADLDLPIVGKWLDMLTQVTPPVTSVALLFNPTSAPLPGLMVRAIEDAEPLRGLLARAAPVYDEAGVVSAIAALSQEPHGGLIVLPDSFTVASRAVILDSTARTRLPAVYWNRSFTDDGGLMSYGVDYADLYRRAAGYVDRILKGAKPGELPVQNPTKLELVVNLKTAKALGIAIAPTLLATADGGIE
jgi:putative tryptophan/tyrosine transport system substrate-binding protein